MTISMYTDDFDGNDVSNGGFSGHVFVENKNEGTEFRNGSLSENMAAAIKFVNEHEIAVDDVIFCYRDGDAQKFRRFKIAENSEFERPVK